MHTYTQWCINYDANGVLAPGPLTLSKLGGLAMSIYFNLLFSQKLKIASKCIKNAAKVNLNTDF